MLLKSQCMFFSNGPRKDAKEYRKRQAELNLETALKKDRKADNAVRNYRKVTGGGEAVPDAPTLDPVLVRKLLLNI